MAAPIINAIANGHTSNQILNYLMRRYPQYASQIQTAQAANYPAHMILKHISDKNNEYSDDNYLTDMEKADKYTKKNREQVNMGLLATAGTAGAVAVGAYGIYQAGRAIRPSQVLPAQRPQIGGGSTTINVRPRGPQPRGGPQGGLPQPQQQIGLPYNPQQPRQVAQQPPAPQPFTPKPTTPPQNVNLIKNIQEETRVENILKQGLPIATAVSVLRAVMPKSKVAILDKTEGGLEKVVSDYAEYLQNNPPAVQEPQRPPQVQQQDQRVISPEEEQARFSINERPSEKTQNRDISPEEQFARTSINERPIEQPKLLSINERIQQAAFDERPELKRMVDASYKGRSLSIPNYKYPGEKPEDFQNRKIIFDAVDKAAKALAEGKSFKDFPVPKEALKYKGGYSVAADVLRFLAGIPNVYDELLDDEEKEDLYDNLRLIGSAGTEKLRPTEGEFAIHGAQMTPNLVWNLLLAVEPRLSTMERPPAIKGAPMKGQKMDTTGFRRFLTHGVYGVLSGKTLPPDLSDKIEKISTATSFIDKIVAAAKDGNFRKVQKEIEEFQNISDQELFAMISDEIDRYETSRIPKEKTGAADTRYANQLKKMREERNEDFKNHPNYEELIANDAEIDKNGNVTVFHRTSKENAKKIKETKKMIAKEDGLFFSTKKDGQSTGYGEGIIKLKIPIDKLLIDDVFGDEVHLRIPLKNKSEIFDISKYLLVNS